MRVPAGTKIAMECRNLAKTLGEGEASTQALRGVDMQLPCGEVSAVVGPSGCGKSTLLYLLGLLDEPSGGEVVIDGVVVPRRDDGERTRLRGDHIGFVFQFHFLLPEFTALENIMLPMRKLGRVSEEEMVDRGMGLLKQVGIGDKAGRRPSQLSGGEQQRVAIARALANRPSVLLADEPTGNLDARNSVLAFDALTRLAKEQGQAVLIVTHNPELAARCDRILKMEDGLFLEPS